MGLVNPIKNSERMTYKNYSHIYTARLTVDDLHTCSFFRSYMFWMKANLKDMLQYCYIRKPTVDTQINGFKSNPVNVSEFLAK